MNAWVDKRRSGDSFKGDSGALTFVERERPAGAAAR